MSKFVKELQINELETCLGTRPAIGVIGCNRLRGVESNLLRGRLRAQGLRMKVVKNTLAQRALKDSPVRNLGRILKGPCAVIYGTNGTSAASSIARVLLTELKQHESLRIEGIIDGETIYSGKEGVIRASKLPTKKEAISQIVSAILAPGQNLLRSLGAPADGLSAVLAALGTEELRATTRPKAHVSSGLGKLGEEKSAPDLTVVRNVGNIPPVVVPPQTATQPMGHKLYARSEFVVQNGLMEEPQLNIVPETSRKDWNVRWAAIEESAHNFAPDSRDIADPAVGGFDIRDLTLPGVRRFDFRFNQTPNLPQWFVDVQCDANPANRTFSVIWPHSGDFKKLWLAGMTLMSQLASLQGIPKSSASFHVRIVLRDQELEEDVTFDDKDAVWAEVEKNVTSDPLRLVTINRNCDEFMIRSGDESRGIEKKVGLHWSWDTTISTEFTAELGDCLAQTGPEPLRGCGPKIAEQVIHLVHGLKSS